MPCCNSSSRTNNVKVQFIKQGDAGQALTRAILTKDNPEADVIFGVDNTFMSRALDAGILEPYQPIGLAEYAAASFNSIRRNS